MSGRYEITSAGTTVEITDPFGCVLTLYDGAHPTMTGAIRQLLADLAAVSAERDRLRDENAALLAANRDCKLHFDALKGDYDEAAHFARHFIRDDPSIGTEPAPVAEIRDVVVTDEMCDRAYIGKWRGVPELIGHEPDDEDRQWSREWLEAWRSELGPALGLVEIREPTPEECERICTEYERLLMREGTCGGRDAFDAVRAVMWPKSEGS